MIKLLPEDLEILSRFCGTRKVWGPFEAAQSKEETRLREIADLQNKHFPDIPSQEEALKGPRAPSNGQATINPEYFKTV